MYAFSTLLDRLVYTQSRNAKTALIVRYFERTRDPDRGWALAAFAGELDMAVPVRRVMRQLLDGRVDPELYRLSREYVGDTAETVALLWPESETQDSPEQVPHLGEIIEAIRTADRFAVPELLAGWLDRLDTTGRWALLKLLTGGLRVGVSARLAKHAAARFGRVHVAEVEEVWHGLSAPYEPLFAWLSGKADVPDMTGLPVFRPLMLATSMDINDLDAIDISEYAAEWKWDGIRVQLACANGEARLYSRSGDDISRTFPDVVQAITSDGVLDGELLVVRSGNIAPFNDLQQRLNRKVVSARLLTEFPAQLRLYDILHDGDSDLRNTPWRNRRQSLEKWMTTNQHPRLDLSKLLQFSDRSELAEIWSSARDIGIEGLMLKRKESPYLSGRPKGHWFKWKRAPLTLDTVLMYAERGSGKRSSFFSDYTFGVWRTHDDGTEELVPVGKAYSGFTDDELRRIDKWVRANTVNRFGPVSSVTPGIVFEVAFDTVHHSPRHKSGVAMRFPRIHRIRWDKPVEEADGLEAVLRLIEERVEPHEAEKSRRDRAQQLSLF